MLSAQPGAVFAQPSVSSRSFTPVTNHPRPRPGGELSRVPGSPGSGLLEHQPGREVSQVRRQGPALQGPENYGSGNGAGWGHQVSSRDTPPSQGHRLLASSPGRPGSQGQRPWACGVDLPDCLARLYQGSSRLAWQRKGRVSPPLIHDVGINT